MSCSLHGLDESTNPKVITFAMVEKYAVRDSSKVVAPTPCAVYCSVVAEFLVGMSACIWIWKNAVAMVAGNEACWKHKLCIHIFSARIGRQWFPASMSFQINQTKKQSVLFDSFVLNLTHLQALVHSPNLRCVSVLAIASYFWEFETTRAKVAFANQLHHVCLL